VKTLEEILAFNIQRRMNDLGLSQKDLATKSGLTVQAVNRYLKGKQYPRLSYLNALAKALRCSKEDLLGLTSSLKIPQDILEGLARADEDRLDDFRVLLRIPIPAQERPAAKTKL
jgi:transcriptional regulator with XRE-family HTH domain